MNTVADALRSIAENIEILGHYRGKPGEHLLDHKGNGKCCLIVNPTLRALQKMGESGSEIFWGTRIALHDAFATYQVSMSQHSDVTPTSVLIDQLRSLADHLENQSVLARSS